MNLIAIFLVAVSLSMDAFSLSLLYGTLNLKRSVVRGISLTVGVFHFFMPLFGYLFGDILSSFLIFNPDLLVGTIFIILSIQMFLSLRQEEEIMEITSIFSYLLFGFTVSLDSFTVGIGLGGLQEGILLPCIIFSITSCVFTYLGLVLGGRLASKFGQISTILGSILLFVLGLFYIF